MSRSPRRPRCGRSPTPTPPSPGPWDVYKPVNWQGRPKALWKFHEFFPRLNRVKVSLFHLGPAGDAPFSGRKHPTSTRMHPTSRRKYPTTCRRHLTTRRRMSTTGRAIAKSSRLT
jgi:hypothetical protein